nr:hypothetical protein [Crocosphaera sp.]
EYLNGNFQESQELIELSIVQSKSAIDSSAFYYLQIVQCTLQGKATEALKVGREALQSLGINLPTDNFKSAFEKELTEYRQNIANYSVSELLYISEMKQLEKQAAMKLLSRLVPPAWLLNSTLMYTISTKMVNLCIKYGNTSSSSTAYSVFGLVNSHALKDYHSGYEFGDLSIKLADKYQNLSAKGVSCHLHGNMTMPWLFHVKLSEKINNQGIDASFQVGDFQVIGYSLTYKLYTLIYQGKNLEILLQEIEQNLHCCRDIQHEWATNCILAAKIIINNLTSTNQDKFCFDLEELSESDFLEICDEQTESMAIPCFYQILKAQALYLY